MRSLMTVVAVLLVLPSAPAVAFDPASLRGSHTDATFERGSAAPRGRLGLVSVADDRLSDAAGADIVESAGEMAQGTLPVMTLDKATLNFGALSNFALQTGAQVVRLRQAGAGTVTWTAASSQPWLQVSPASGTGGGPFTVRVVPVGGLPAAGTVTGTITLSFNGASTGGTVINVNLRLQPNGSTAPPIGFVDTPLDNTTGVTGAIPVTGWALDDIDIAAVSVCRAPIGGEGVTPGACGGAAQVFIGDAVFIEGARPDLPAVYPGFPRNTQGGWGLMVLTNMLPNKGNGSYSFSVWARDVEGASVLLGTRTITCDNDHATLPFGTIDTPAQGEAIQGEPYVNFGWALTQQPKFILEHNLLSALVYIDGGLLGPADYGFYRSDIATLFPGYANSDTAVGFRQIFTSTLAEGLHTIVWLVTDSSGAAQGIGSRYFTVAAGPSASRAAAVRATSAASTLAVDASTVASATLDSSPIKGRRGWVADGPWRSYGAVAGGNRVVVQGEELDRIELQLSTAGGGKVAGFMRVGQTLQPLPVGSRLDTSTGVFTWSPGVGFVGTYDLVFLRGTAGQQVTRQEVRVVLRAKGSGPLVVIDTPSSMQSVGQPFVLAGWAADLDAAGGTGIDTLHVWAYPTTGGAPRFLGVASPGYARSDVADAYGDQFASSGYGLVVQGLDPGSYDIAVFAWSSARAGFMPARLVRVTVR